MDEAYLRAARGKEHERFDSASSDCVALQRRIIRNCRRKARARAHSSLMVSPTTQHAHKARQQPQVPITREVLVPGVGCDACGERGRGADEQRL